VGAFTADGAKITTVTAHGCVGTCDTAQLAARQWTLDYLDTGTGAAATGPALPPVTAMAVRALGWRQHSDLVVETYQPRPGVATTAGVPFNDTGDGNVTAARLVALRADGQVESLLDSPDDVAAIDIPQQLVEAGRFGGADVTPSALPVARPYALLGGALTVMLLLTVAAATLLIRSRRREGRRLAPPPFPQRRH
jgi:hypothetical protein